MFFHCLWRLRPLRVDSSTLTRLHSPALPNFSLSLHYICIFWPFALFSQLFMNISKQKIYIIQCNIHRTANIWYFHSYARFTRMKRGCILFYHARARARFRVKPYITVSMRRRLFCIAWKNAVVFDWNEIFCFPKKLFQFSKKNFVRKKKGIFRVPFRPLHICSLRGSGR